MENTLTKAEWAIMSALWKKPNQTISGIIETAVRRTGLEIQYLCHLFTAHVRKGICEL